MLLDVNIFGVSEVSYDINKVMTNVDIDEDGVFKV